MNVRPHAVIHRRASAVGIVMLTLAFIGPDACTTARAQGGHAANQPPAQGTGTPGSRRAYRAPHMQGHYSPYPVRDPTAGERAVVAGRVYRSVLDEWARWAETTPRPGGAPPDLEARSRLERTERLGSWSLRWQEAEDNAARSLAARYQSLTDHLGRMTDLEEGRPWHDSRPANGKPVDPLPPRVSAEAARFFRPIDEWEIDRIGPTHFLSERPLNPLGVAVSPAEQVEIAGRVYGAILDEAVNRFLAFRRDGERRREEVAVFDALLAERLGFWSELWRQSQELAVGDLSSRSATVPVPAVRARFAGPGGPMSPIRSHIERMRELESGRFLDDALGRPGRSTAAPVDMTRFREFAEVARFFRIEAESRLPGAAGPKDTFDTASSQAATAGRIYHAILDGAARRYRESPDVRLAFDSRLAERLATWSIRWARAEIAPTRAVPHNSPPSGCTSRAWRHWRTADRSATH